MTRSTTAGGAARSTGIVHVHTAYSHDGRDSIADLAGWAQQRGIAFIGITDHAEDLDREKWASLVAECAAHSSDTVVLFPGLEFRFAGFTGIHLLALGLREWITPGTPQEFIALTSGRCELTIGAHPVIWRVPCPDDVLAKLDAVEVWNGGYNSRFLPDPAAMTMVRALRRRGLSTVATVGPDQHDRRRDQGLRIVADGPASNALALIRAGRFMNRGRTLSLPHDMSWSAPRHAALVATRQAFDLLKGTRDRLVRVLK